MIYKMESGVSVVVERVLEHSAVEAGRLPLALERLLPVEYFLVLSRDRDTSPDRDGTAAHRATQSRLLRSEEGWPTAGREARSQSLEVLMVWLRTFMRCEP